ncbi:VanW family protein [Risungbinella massiliensis]|uniref:VanW family protein n=1 Tax=Risungbinella massiliensis TaxID=1329796 RepID=UPI00069CA66B|nr:VanW family protein [Risungbinella massiliensis]
MEEKKGVPRDQNQDNTKNQQDPLVTGETNTWLFDVEDLNRLAEEEESNPSRKATFSFQPNPSTEDIAETIKKQDVTSNPPSMVTKTAPRPPEMGVVSGELSEDIKDGKQTVSPEKKEKPEPVVTFSTIDSKTTVDLAEEPLNPVSEEVGSSQSTDENEVAVPEEQSILTPKPASSQSTAEIAAAVPEIENTFTRLEKEKKHDMRMQTRRKRFVLVLSTIVIILGAIGFFSYDWSKVSGETIFGQSKKLILELDGKEFETDLTKMGYDGKDLKTINETQLRQWLDSVKKQVDVPAVNAKATKVDGTIQPEKVGRYMDTKQVNEWLKDIPSLINKPRQIPIIVVQPTITTEDIKNVQKKLAGSYTTKFDGKNENRTTNIRLSSEAIDGLILMPGEEFSFNKVVGERTAKRGYKEAGIIVKGEFSEGIGGGICQVSSTLYNSVDEAGLKITRRYSHSATVTYVPKGRDATVSWGGPDFRFQNNLDKPIMIRIVLGTNSITVKTYTVPSAKVQKKKVEPAPQTFVEMQVDPTTPTDKLPTSE